MGWAHAPGHPLHGHVQAHWVGLKWALCMLTKALNSIKYLFEGIGIVKRIGFCQEEGRRIGADLLASRSPSVATNNE